MKNVIALVIAAGSAYSFSFAIDLLLGGLLGVYPSIAFLPVVTWSVIAAVTGVVALRLAPTGHIGVKSFVDKFVGCCPPDRETLQHNQRQIFTFAVPHSTKNVVPDILCGAASQKTQSLLKQISQGCLVGK